MDIFILSKRIGNANFSAISAHHSEEEAWVAAGKEIFPYRLQELGIDPLLAHVAAKCWDRFSEGQEEFRVQRTPYVKSEDDPLKSLMEFAKNIPIEVIATQLEIKLTHLYDEDPKAVFLLMLLEACDRNEAEVRKLLK